jgi:general stress protein 26
MLPDSSFGFRPGRVAGSAHSSLRERGPTVFAMNNDIERNGNGETKGSVAEVLDLLHDFGTVMLSTLTADHAIRSRPMAVQKPGGVSDCDLWLVTSLDSPKTGEIAADESVCVCAYKNGKYLSISATARVLRDPALVKRLWQPDWKVWFPNGAEDPTIAILALRINRAEYFNPEGGLPRILFEQVKAFFKGESAASALPPPKRI